MIYIYYVSHEQLDPAAVVVMNPPASRPSQFLLRRERLDVFPPPVFLRSIFYRLYNIVLGVTVLYSSTAILIIYLILLYGRLIDILRINV